MTIAEQILELKQDFDEVYAKGKADGQAEGGGCGEYVTSLSNTFREAVFPENYDLVFSVDKIVIANIEGFTYKAKNLRSITINFLGEYANALLGNNFVRECGTLEMVDLTKFKVAFSTLSWAFLGCSNLKYIYGALDFSKLTAATLWLSGVTNLEHIEFVPETINISLSFQWCKYLSKASLISAINGLSTSVTGQTATFSKQAVNNAFGIDVDDESTYTEEFNTLRNSRSNWTFSYIKTT